MPMPRALLLVVLAAAPAHAADPGALSGLLACRTIKAEAQRLACFDEAAKNLAAASERRDVIVMDQGEVRHIRRSLFGFQLPRVALFAGERPDSAKDGNGKDSGDDVDVLQATIQSISALADGRYQFTLPEAGVWRTVESWPGPGEPRVGDAITLKRAALGSFMARIGRNRSVRATRLR